MSKKSDTLSELSLLMAKTEAFKQLLEESIEAYEERISVLEAENAGMKARLEQVEIWKKKMNEILPDP